MQHSPQESGYSGPRDNLHYYTGPRVLGPVFIVFPHLRRGKLNSHIFIWDALCSQHFEYGSNYGHVTFGIRVSKLLVETETVSQVKKLMIYGNLYSPVLLLMNPWL